MFTSVFMSSPFLGWQPITGVMSPLSDQEHDSLFRYVIIVIGTKFDLYCCSEVQTKEIIYTVKGLPTDKYVFKLYNIFKTIYWLKIRFLSH